MTVVEALSVIAPTLGIGTALGAIVRGRVQRQLATDERLWKRVEKLEADLGTERAKCDERIAVVEGRVDAAEKRGEECERRAAALDGELREVRRAIGLRHPTDDTARHGLPPKGDNRR